MTTLKIVATITAKDDQIDLVKSELEKLIPITRKEAGCLQYDLHRDNENPACFVFVEEWDSKEALQAHLRNDHISAYAKATKDAIISFTLQELTQSA